MKYMGLDLGSKTLGVSVSDKMGIIANSLRTVKFDNEDYDALSDTVVTLVDSENIDTIILGLPKNMDNTIGERALITLEFQKKLENKLNIPIIMQDERLSTREATNVLINADMSRKKRKKVIDALAATIILQTYLDRK